MRALASVLMRTRLSLRPFGLEFFQVMFAELKLFQPTCCEIISQSCFSNFFLATLTVELVIDR